MAAGELTRLGESSTAVASAALRIIDADAEAATGRMRESLLTAWLRPLVVGLSFFLGTCGGSWATTYLVAEEQHRPPARDAGEGHGAESPGARDLGGDGGDDRVVELVEIDGERYVALPAAAPGRPAFTMDGQLYMNLSRE